MGQILVQDWKVDTSSSLSVHQLHSFSLSLGATLTFATRSSAKCGWPLYQELVKSALEQHMFWFQPVATVEDFSKRQILHCFFQACPVIRRSLMSSSPWWTADLTAASQSTKALRRKANRTKNNQDWEHYVSHISY